MPSSILDAGPRSSSCNRSRLLSFFQLRNYQFIASQGGKSYGKTRHRQQVRSMYKRALTISRRPYLAGRPPDLGAVVKRSIRDYSRSVRSLG